VAGTHDAGRHVSRVRTPFAQALEGIVEARREPHDRFGRAGGLRPIGRVPERPERFVERPLRPDWCR
jgi:hypothetical protein